MVKVPAQAVDHRGALRNQPLVMLVKQPDLQLFPSKPGSRQILKPVGQGRAGDRERVDGVRLAARPDMGAGLGHEVRGETGDALAVIEQEALQQPGDMPAILDDPDPLVIKFASPVEQHPEPVTDGPDLADCDLPANPVDRDGLMGLLVRVDPDRHHVLVPSLG